MGGGGSSKLTLLSACIWSCYEQFITILLFGTMQSHPFYVCFSTVMLVLSKYSLEGQSF